LVTAALDRSSNEFLVRVRTVDLCGIQMGDAQVQRAMDGTDRLRIATGTDVVVAGHRHGAESNTGYVESAD
jgi:hypothetical protein